MEAKQAARVGLQYTCLQALHRAALPCAPLIFMSSLGKVLPDTALASASPQTYSSGTSTSVFKRNLKNSSGGLLMTRGLSMHQGLKQSPELPQALPSHQPPRLQMLSARLLLTDEGFLFPPAV